MKARFFTAVCSALFITSSSFGSIVINFEELPNEAGISLYGQRFDGLPFGPVIVGAETFHLSSPIIPGGYPADATLSHIGISLSADHYLVNILETAGGSLSDQVWVHLLSGNFTVIDFISDPGQFVTGVAPVATIVETGSLQHALDYTNDRGELVSINILSDTDTGTVPEPASLFVWSLLAIAIGGASWWKGSKPTA